MDGAKWLKLEILQATGLFLGIWRHWRGAAKLLQALGGNICW
jgi:hypothetical protein